MPQALNPQIIMTRTSEGELTIRMIIDLNLNLNGQVSSVTASTDEMPIPMAQKPTDTEWMVPEFNTTEKIEFGKYEK